MATGGLLGTRCGQGDETSALDRCPPLSGPGSTTPNFLPTVGSREEQACSRSVFQRSLAKIECSLSTQNPNSFPFVPLHSFVLFQKMESEEARQLTTIERIERIQNSRTHVSHVVLC